MRLLLLFAACCLGGTCFAGTIAYEIVDYRADPSGRVIASGTRNQVPADLAVRHREFDDEEGKFTYVSRTLVLEDGYGLLFVVETGKAPQWLALAVKTERTEDFSWEHFRLQKGAVFAKRGEGGDVRLRTRGREVTRLEFLTDVSLRVSELASLGKDVTRRVNIKKGSVLTVLP